VERLLIWRGLEEWLAEAAYIRIEDGRLSAHGTQLGAEPDPYRLDYSLRTGPDFVTEALELSVLRGGALRRLLLARGPDGGWTADDRPLPELEGALDCDLAFSPLTNAMPMLRHGLREAGAEPRDFAMAWVAVPGLEIHRSPQRYEPMDEQHVRFVSLDSSFTAELELDDDGLVVRYPRLAERV
jgi:uncharacterized protein